MSDKPSFLDRFPFHILVPGIALWVGLLIPVLYKVLNGSSIYGRELKLLYASHLVFSLTILGAAVWSFVRARLARVSHSVGAGVGVNSAKESGVQTFIDSHSTGRLARRKRQFGVRDLLIWTTGFSVLCAGSTVFSEKIRCYVLVGIIAGIFVRTIIFRRKSLARVFCWLGAMYLPFVWVIPFNKPFGQVSGMLEGIPVYPVLLLATLSRLVVDVHPLEGPPAFILASLVLGLGVFLTQRRGWGVAVFVCVTLVISCLTSMFLHLMYRA